MPGVAIMTNSKINKLIVMHSIGAWLPTTQSWLWRQLSFIDSSRMEQIVVSDTIDGEERYGIKPVASFDNESTLFKKYFSFMGFLRRTNRSQYILHVMCRYKLLDGNTPVILHSHFGNRGYDNFLFAQKNGFKHLVSFYGFDASLLPKQDPVWVTRYREMLAGVDRVLCEGPYMQSQVIRFNPDCADKVKVLNIGVDLDLLPFNPRVWKPGQPLKVLMAGRFVEKKGFYYAIAALKKLSPMNKIDLTIVGDSSGDPRSEKEKARILEQIKTCHFNSIKMLGLIPYAALLDQAKNHHIFLSPSVVADDGDAEGGCPVIITELAATGMPVISTKHCDISYVLDQQVTLSEEKNIDDIVRQIQDWLSHPDLWEQRLYHGRKRIESDFDVKKQAAKLLDIYSCVVQS